VGESPTEGGRRAILPGCGHGQPTGLSGTGTVRSNLDYRDNRSRGSLGVVRFGDLFGSIRCRCEGVADVATTGSAMKSKPFLPLQNHHAQASKQADCCVFYGLAAPGGLGNKPQVAQYLCASLQRNISASIGH
jgi:hypothetical protein